MDLEGVVEVEEVLHLVVGDGAVDDGLLAGADNDEGELDGGVGCGGSGHLLCLTVPLNQVLRQTINGIGLDLNTEVWAQSVILEFVSGQKNKTYVLCRLLYISPASFLYIPTKDRLFILIVFLESYLLEDEILQLLGFSLDSLQSFCLVVLHGVGLLQGVGGESQPTDLLLLLTDNVHCLNTINNLSNSIS